MARTAAMRLIELMIMKNDIDRVIEYLGKKGTFEFHSRLNEPSESAHNSSREVFEKLQVIRAYFAFDDLTDYTGEPNAPRDDDYAAAASLISSAETLRERELSVQAECKRVQDAYNEALAFANLKVSYGELEHLSFLSLRIGKIDPALLDDLRFSLGDRAIVVPLGEDKTRVMAAASRKARFVLDTELKKFGFVELEIPKNFKGIPDDVLAGMKEQVAAGKTQIAQLSSDRAVFAKEKREELFRLLQVFSVGMQVQALRDKLEATQLVYRITGWIPAYESKNMVRDLDTLTEGRIAVRQYQPNEISSVREGREKVPVKLRHGKLVKSFEGMVFSYGAPLYGTIDPTPFVAFFFTLLFGIMFGDAGQGLVFLIIGVLLTRNIVKLKNWNKYGLVFIAIGCASICMGLLTGEFFASTTLLVPFGRFVTGLFGEPRDIILELMPRSDAIAELFIFFGFTLSIGFIINSIGLIINFINNITLKRYSRAFFGKTGLCGALFFWYVIAMAVRMAAFKHHIALYDWIIIGVTLLGVFFATPLERLVEGHRPIFENGIGSGIIEGMVELLDVVSGYLSNTVSFLRVGAFALAHVVLGFIIFEMTALIGGVGGLAVTIFGNLIVIVLEGMIVAIQVIRLQYYEFFSKFFVDTGKEFQPFRFEYYASGKN